MSVPSMTTEPRSGFSRPIRVLSSTDLPVPDGPSITQISPAGTVRVTSPQMSCLPKDLVSPSILISTPMAPRLPSLRRVQAHDLSRKERLPFAHFHEAQRARPAKVTGG